MAAQKYTAEQIQVLEQELRHTRENLQAMIEEQSSSLDPAKRKQILQQMDRKIIETAAWPTLGWRLHWEVWWPEVKGYRAMSSVQNAPRFDHVWLAQ